MSFAPVFFSQPISVPITLAIILVLPMFLRFRFVEVTFIAMAAYLRILFSAVGFTFTLYHVIGGKAAAMLTNEKEMVLLIKNGK